MHMAAKPSATKPSAAKSKRSKRSASKRSEQPVRIVIKHRGDLGAHGYTGVAGLTLDTRRAALRRAAAQWGWLHVLRKLNALYVFNKYRNPELAARFMENRNFASREYAALKAAKA